MPLPSLLRAEPLAYLPPVGALAAVVWSGQVLGAGSPLPWALLGVAGLDLALLWHRRRRSRAGVCSCAPTPVAAGWSPAGAPPVRCPKEMTGEHLPMAVVSLDADLSVVRTNRALRTLCGVPDAAPVAKGTPLAALLDPPGLEAHLRGVLATGQAVGDVVLEWTAADGHRRALRASIGPVRQPDARLMLVLEDRTEETRLRAEARASESSFRTVVDNAPEMMAVRRGRRFIHFNRAMAAALGYGDPGEMAGRPVLDFIHPDDRAATRDRMETLDAAGGFVRTEVRLLRKDGTALEVEGTALSVAFDGAPGVLVIFQDLSERRLLQARRMEMDRLIALARMAAGVGHEINNPLAYVIANLDLLAEELPQEVESWRLRNSGAFPAATPPSTRLEDLVEILREAKDGASRVRAIVDDLKILSRTSTETRVPLDVRRLVDASLNVVGHEIRHRGRLLLDYGEVPLVRGSPVRLGQVFTNLLTNAGEALPEGAEANAVTVRIFTEGEHAVVEIADNGCGIADHHRGRLFEPFFTTKPVGQGTGLGLAICRHTVDAHGGEIAVDTAVGRGTRIRVALPALVATPLDGSETG